MSVVWEPGVSRVGTWCQSRGNLVSVAWEPDVSHMGT